MENEATQVVTEETPQEAAPVQETVQEPASIPEPVEAQPVAEEPVAEAATPAPLTKYERIMRSLGDIPEEANETLLESIDEKTIEKLPASAKGVLRHLIAQQNAQHRKMQEEREQAFKERQSKIEEFEQRVQTDAKNLIRNRAELNKMLLDPKFQKLMQQANLPEEEMADAFTPEGIQQRIEKGVAQAMKQFQEPITAAAHRSQQMAQYQEFLETHPKMSDASFKREVRTLMEQRQAAGQPIPLEDAYNNVDRSRMLQEHEKRLAAERQARARSAQKVSRSTVSSSGESQEPVPNWVTERGYKGHRGQTARIHYLRDNPKALEALRAQQKNR
tara:strand:- start:1115 stop:2110 length:996 start_codon:yes stop_codon:yes gene_type:complete